MRPLLFSRPRRGLASANLTAPAPSGALGNQARLRSLGRAGRTAGFEPGVGDERITVDAGPANPDAGALAGVGAIGVPGGALPGAALAGGAAGVVPPANCGVHSGPTYTPTGSIPVITAGGRKSAAFRFAAVFRTASPSNQWPGCCSVRQFIKWDTRFHTAAGGPPHSGFPASSPADTWIEDRHQSGWRYGHRSGPMSMPAAGCGNEYLLAGVQDMAHGDTYCGRDGPSGPASDVGQYQFQLKVLDTCAGVEKASSSIITVAWG